MMRAESLIRAGADSCCAAVVNSGPQMTGLLCASNQGRDLVRNVISSALRAMEPR